MFILAPPNCRPECLVNSDCPNLLACMNKKCKDPCINACGLNARCSVINHNPVCTCIDGYKGDPFYSCEKVLGMSFVFQNEIFIYAIYNNSFIIFITIYPFYLYISNSKY